MTGKIYPCSAVTLIVWARVTRVTPILLGLGHYSLCGCFDSLVMIPYDHQRLARLARVITRQLTLTGAGSCCPGARAAAGRGGSGEQRLNTRMPQSRSELDSGQAAEGEHRS